LNATVLVSVVIPAFDAATTLDDTLTSVRAQTHAALEIIVVDDGSTDDTAAIAMRHAAQDARVRLLRQANAGVAAARNAGWREARAVYVAFIDADDLWAPTNVERQVHALSAAGPRVGLVYSWSKRIDARGRIVSSGMAAQHEGSVFDAILRSNFVGNGSAAMVRKDVLDAVGGFDCGLRSGGGQGCEDWLLYARVAARWDFVLVREALVGYRDTPGAMSSDRLQMLRSHVLMCRRLQAAHPDRATSIRVGLRGYATWILLAERANGGWLRAARVWWLLRAHPQAAGAVMLLDVPHALFVRFRHRLARALGLRAASPHPSGAGTAFLEVPPDRRELSP
jgi:glycosyltransferase involved in cell wall biosynthesis